MPNAARLVSALSLALIAYIVSGLIMPLFPEGKYFGWFTHVNVGLGLVVGWVVMGRRAGRGITAAINNGFTGMVSLVFWALFVQGCYEMIRLAMRNRYDGPLEAVTGIFKIGIDYSLFILTPGIISTLLIGAVLAGLATEYAWRKWR